jgi:hypothetical protein
VLAIVCATALLAGAERASSGAVGPCGSNPIVCENQLPGTPQAQWDIEGSGDPTIQGYATPFSVVDGQTVRFKVDTDASDYRLEIYRLGWYDGMGARLVTTVLPSAALPQDQPNCILQAAVGLVDCGNWAESASWPVPQDAVSGVYLARLVRTDTGGSSHVVFVVRNDQSASDLLFQTADTTWQAYNRYGGYSLYFGPTGRAYKVSYNRPFETRGHNNESWLFSGEYPMIRWLERNGYDVSYTTGIDTDRAGAELLEHHAFLSVGHDEYWSGTQRANVEAARSAGVNLAFFSGNEVFWKTRWEPSIDGSSTPHTTLVSYKETAASAKIDPSSEWTGTWRDPRFSPPADGGRPENELTGTLFTVNSYQEQAIKIPAAMGSLRFWRNTTVASLPVGGTATLPLGVLGHEWDEDVDNGFRPAGLMRLSSTTLAVDRYIQDNGNVYGPGTGTHSLTLYRAPSGALVFGAGTVQWAWGLDEAHDVFTTNPPRPADARMRQATVNLLADMNAQPGTLQSGLVGSVPSTDATAPTSFVTAPAHGSVVTTGTTVTIQGTASDQGGVVAGVEVTTDGGETWHRASGTTSWTYAWVAGGDRAAVIRSRAVDDTGNLELPGAGITVDVTCPCRLWSSIAVPTTAASTDAGAVELGVKFAADTSGWVSGVRFFKGAGNAGTHTGSLWTTSGTLLARARFTGETATGWQQVQFDQPVAINAGTTYVVSYHAPAGHYALDLFYFNSAHENGLLHAPRSATSGGNGLYSYSGTPAFPTSNYGSSNYWVDVVYYDQTPVDKRRPTVVARTPDRGATNADAFGSVSATFSEAISPSTVSAATFKLRDAGGADVPGVVAYDAIARKATFTPSGPLQFGGTYTAVLEGGAGTVADTAGNTLAADDTWSFTTATSPGCPCSLFGAGQTPDVASTFDAQSVELGVKFRSDVAGWVTGIRFFKGASNTGVHVGSLWNSNGDLLARVTFVGETANGWQSSEFGGPVAIAAGETYLVSYFAPNGRYALTASGLAEGASSPPLRAPNGANGVYKYASAPVFPTESYQSSNYWVDVEFTLTQPADAVAPRVEVTSPTNGAAGVGVDSVASATFSEALDPASVAGNARLESASGAVPADVTYDAATRSVRIAPHTADFGATYTAVLVGGASGIRDVAGNPLAADVQWTYTIENCPCTVFGNTANPSISSSGDSAGVELGVKLRSDRAGWITGVRFYKGAGNTGTHTGSLWASDGRLLERAVFTSEGATGWQSVSFDLPVRVEAGTTYVASYYAPNGGYAVTAGGLTSSTGGAPIRALAAGEDGANGVFKYGSAPAYPTDTYGSANYWVDALFTTTAPPDSGAPSVTVTTPTTGATGVELSSTVRVTFSEAVDPSTVTATTVVLETSAGAAVPGTVTYDSAAREATLTPSAPLTLGGSYIATVHGGATGVKDLGGNPLAGDVTWSFAARTCPCTLFSSDAVPALAAASGAEPLEVGMKFQSDIAGTITGIRFYQGPGNVGPHTASLWAVDGTLLARAPVSEAAGSGWRVATFTTPVSIAAATTYVASYFAPSGHYAVNLGFFTAPFAYSPLRAAGPSAGANGVYSYGSSPAFPTESWDSSNYWVDVFFQPS